MSATRDRRQRPRLFDPVVGQHKPKLIRNGTIFCVLVAIFLYVIYTKPSIPFLSSSGTSFSANFASAADIVPGRTPVDVYGVQVGVVTKVQRDASGKGANVTMALAPGSNLKLHSDASAKLEWRTLLGLNYYVNLNPGSDSAPPLGSTPIPESRTSVQVELDQALEPLNPTGRKALGTMIDQFDTGFKDPQAVRGTIESAGPAMQNLAAGLPGLRGTQPGTDLPKLISSTDKWMGALAADDQTLGAMVDNGATALNTVAANRAALGATFDNAPQALQQTQLTMVRLQKTLNILDPIAKQLEPGAKDLAHAADVARTAVNAAQPLLVQLQPTLAAIRPSVNSLAVAADKGVPVVQQLSPVLDRTNKTFIPWLNQTDSSTKLKNYEAVGPTLASVSSVLGYGDQYGTLAGFEAGAGENLVGGFSPCSTYIADPTKPLTSKIDCQALTDLLTSIFSGHAPTSAQVKGNPVSQSLVQKLLRTGKP